MVIAVKFRRRVKSALSHAFVTMNDVFARAERDLESGTLVINCRRVTLPAWILREGEEDGFKEQRRRGREAFRPG